MPVPFNIDKRVVVIQSTTYRYIYSELIRRTTVMAWHWFQNKCRRRDYSIGVTRTGTLRNGVCCFGSLSVERDETVWLEPVCRSTMFFLVPFVYISPSFYFFSCTERWIHYCRLNGYFSQPKPKRLLSLPRSYNIPKRIETPTQP